MEDAIEGRKVGVLNQRLLHKRRRGHNPKYKAEVIEFNHLKTSNLGYPKYKGGVVEEWTTEEQPHRLTNTTMKPMLEGGSLTNRRIARPRRRILEQVVEPDLMEMDVGHGPQRSVGATATPMDTNDEDDLSHTLMEGANGKVGAGDGGGPEQHTRRADWSQGAMDGRGSMAALQSKTTRPTGYRGPQDGGGPVAGSKMENEMELETTIGGGSLPMEVEDDRSYNDSTKYKGTIRAYFTKLHHKGAKPTKPLQREYRFGGGSRTMTNSLKTTMKKVRKSGKKTGILATRGAKSRIGRDLMKQKQGSDSSQMEIGKFFPRKVGIIGPGLAKIGRIPMGEDQNPLKTREFQ